MADVLLTSQLESVKGAQQRTRKAFFLSLLVSSVVLFFAFSLTFSQGAKRPDPACCFDDNGDLYFKPDGTHGRPGKEYELRLKTYLDRWNYSVPLLGITLSLEDFGLVAPLSLFIFSFYYTSCLRNVVSQLLDLSKVSLTQGDRSLARLTILSELVLNTTSRELVTETDIGSLITRWSLQDVNVYQKLILVPSFASFSALLWDLYYSYLRLDFSSASQQNVSFFTSNKGDPLAQISIVTSDIVGLLMCLVVLSYCLAGRAYLRESSKLTTKIVTNEPDRFDADEQIPVGTVQPTESVYKLKG